MVTVHWERWQEAVQVVFIAACLTAIGFTWGAVYAMAYLR